MKTYRLITTNPLALFNQSLGGLPHILIANTLPPTPAEYSYVEVLDRPVEAPDEGFVWVRELTAEVYGWVQTEAPPKRKPRWYTQPTWRIRAICNVTPYGDGLLMDAIIAAVDAIEDPVQKAVSKEVFFGGNTLERDSMLLVSMAGALGLAEEDLDSIFQQANSIEV